MSVVRLKLVALVALSLAVSGCGGGPNDAKIAVPPSAVTESAKKTLMEFEKTGKITSGISNLESDINGIASQDGAKGEALKTLYRELVGLTKADEVKAKAKEMLSKL